MDARLGCYGNIPLDGGDYEFNANCSLPDVNSIIAEWEYKPGQMRAIHQAWQTNTRKLPKQKIISNRKIDVMMGTGVHFKNPA